MATTCPECDNVLNIDTDEVEEGETVTCDECGTELEIISTEPLQVSPLDAEGYDEDDSYERSRRDSEDEDE